MTRPPRHVNVGDVHKRSATLRDRGDKSATRLTASVSGDCSQHAENVKGGILRSFDSSCSLPLANSLSTIAVGNTAAALGQGHLRRRRIDGMAQNLVTARGIALVPEDRRLFPRLSVRDNLRLGSYLYRSHADCEAPLERCSSFSPIG